MSRCHGLRLLIVGTYPPPFGGIASHLTTLIPGLRSMEAEDIAVLSFSADDKVEERDGFRIYRFNVKYHLRKLFNPANWSMVWRVVRSLAPHKIGARVILTECVKAVLIEEVARRHRSQVASFYQCDLNMQLPALAQAWRGKRAIVLTVFGELYERTSGPFMMERREFFKDMVTAPFAVASSSCHCARSFSLIGVTRQVEPVYYGVELNGATSQDLRVAFRKDNRMAPDDVVVLFMGRLSQEMGLDVLLKAAPALLSRDGRIRLLIAGARGELSEQAAALASAHADRVVLMQNVSFSQQASLYSAADMLVAPSFNQRACMGMAIKEAMAARLPVIGGAGGGVPEAVVEAETGFLVPVASDGAVDADQFVERVMRLVQQRDLREKLGAAGRVRAEVLFSHEKTNERMSAIFMAARASVSS